MEQETILAIGDIHIKQITLPDFELFLNHLLSSISNIQIDFIVLLGDILNEHEKVFTFCLNAAYRLIKALSEIAPIFILVGNHDYCNHTQFLTSNHWMNALKDWKQVTIVDKVIITENKGKKYTFCPYVFPGRFIEALETSKEDWKQTRIIFAHQEFRGVKYGIIHSEIGDEWEDDYPMVISGHIHNKQFLAKNIYYTGSSMQIAFGETADKTIALVTCLMPNQTNNESQLSNISISEIDLMLPKKVIEYVNVSDLTDYEIKESKDKIRLTISGTFDEFKSFKKTKKYRDLVKSGIKVIYKASKNKEEKQLPENLEFTSVLFNLIKDTKMESLFREFFSKNKACN